MLFVLFVWLVVIVPGAYSGEPDASPDFGDMGAVVADPATAWETLDQGTRDRFEREYRNSRNRRALYDEYLEFISGTAILDYLELIDSTCHGKAHALGGAIFSQSQDINESLKICGNRCTNACMHGVVKEAFGGHGHGSEAMLAVMNDFCDQGEMGRLHKPGNCAHGMGHALMLLSKHNIAESLRGCQGFSTPGMDYYCATGVFMEYRGMVKAQQLRGDSVERPSLQYPCNTHTDYPAACYRYMIRQIARETDADLHGLIEMCLESPTDRKAGCFHGLGAMYSKHIAKDFALFNQVCGHGDETDRTLCVEGVIEKMADYDQALAMEACAQVSPDYRPVCEAGAWEKMYRLDKPSMPLYRNTPQNALFN